MSTTRFIAEGALAIRDFPVEIGSVDRVLQSVTGPFRFPNLSGKTDAVRVSFPGRVVAAAETVMANERPLAAGAAPLTITGGGFQLPMGPFALETVRVRHALPPR